MIFPLSFPPKSRPRPRAFRGISSVSVSFRLINHSYPGSGYLLLTRDPKFSSSSYSRSESSRPYPMIAKLQISSPSSPNERNEEAIDDDCLIAKERQSKPRVKGSLDIPLNPFFWITPFHSEVQSSQRQKPKNLSSSLAHGHHMSSNAFTRLGLHATPCCTQPPRIAVAKCLQGKNQGKPE